MSSIEFKIKELEDIIIVLERQHRQDGVVRCYSCFAYFDIDNIRDLANRLNRLCNDIYLLKESEQ